MSTWTTCEIIEEATSTALISVEELKLMLGISAEDVSQHELLQLLIEMASSQISAKCNNRIFAKEKVIETFYDEDVVERLFLSRWPVRWDDIEEILVGGGDVPFLDFDLDVKAGKIINLNGWSPPVVVTYTGGFELPSQSPAALKMCAAMLVKPLWAAAPSGGGGSLAGTGSIRMVAHKEARVMYYPAAGESTSASGKSSSGGGSASERAVDDILKAYTRYWV